MLHLEAGDWKVALQPDLGGTIAALTYRGRDVLRPSPAGANNPLEAGCFPLVPYANRIADGRFVFAGESYALPRNMEGQDHPLHGVGWLRGWDVQASDASSAVLVHTHEADANWPWSYHAEQLVTLDESGLRVSLSVRNDSDRAMPAGLGFHPYFPAGEDTRLSFDAGSVWLADDAMLPTERTGATHFADWSRGDGVVRASLIDNAYEGWDKAATIATPDDTITLTGEGTPYLHVFTPPGLGFFCAEPVSDMPNALNLADPTILAPGEARTIAMGLTVARG
ncbi:aldose 1-epimerase [Sphingomonas sp. 4RDLI-65]|uniref:aldose 1-epimerase n=1 Tax=Sphingomonas sp. 4RDLI-65 TaxID=3111641 RepID=UPI003C29F384